MSSIYNGYRGKCLQYVSITTKLKEEYEEPHEKDPDYQRERA
jgi:hypothetical protein